MMDPKAKLTICDRQIKDKLEVIEQLKKMPIIEAACKRANVGRSTFYRWKSEDAEFSKAADAAMEEGLLLMNDLSENQLFALVKEKNLGAITFFLKHRHPAYGTRVKIEADIKSIINQELTPEQEVLIKEVLRLAALPDSDVDLPKKDASGK